MHIVPKTPLKDICEGIYLAPTFSIVFLSAEKKDMDILVLKWVRLFFGFLGRY
jgi:hypothetical protein